MFSRCTRLAISAFVAALSLTGCLATGPAVPGQLYALSDTMLTVVEQSRPRTIALPAGLKLPALNPAGTQLAGIVDEQLVLIDTNKKEPAVTRVTEAPQSSLIAWSAASDRIALVQSHETITIVDTQGKRGQAFKDFEGDIQSVFWSPDGTRLAVTTSMTGTSPTVWIADLASGRTSIAAKNGQALAWAPDSKSLIVSFWDDRGADRVAALHFPGETKVLVSEEILSAFRPDLADLLAKNDPHTYWAGWSPKGDVLTVNLKAAGPDPRYVMLTMGPDGKLLGAWVLPVFPQANMFPPLPCSPGPAAWGLNQERLVTRLVNPGCEGKVAILDARTLEQIGELRTLPKSTVLTSPDGAWVAHRHPDGDTVDVTNLSDSTRKVSLPVTGELLLWVGR